MIDFSPFPDSEAIASAQLRDQDVCGGRVYSSHPKKDPVYPLAVVRRLGGVPAVRRRLDAARIQVDVYGNNKSEARAAAEAARLALHRAEGTTFAEFEGHVTGVEDELGLTFLPDPDTARDRYTFSVALFAHHDDTSGLT